MKSKLLHGIMAIAIFFGLSLFFMVLTGRGGIRATASAPSGHAAEYEGDAHDEIGHENETAVQDHAFHVSDEHLDEHKEAVQTLEASDGHDHGSAVDTSNREALFTARCEHDMPILTCSECRYEVGVARIERSLSEAMIDTQVVEEGSTAEMELKLTGEVQLDLGRVVEVASVGNGRVESLHKILGDQVKISTALAVIQSSEFGQAQAEFLTSKAKLDLAQSTFEREDKLYKQQISSEADFLAASHVFKAAQAAFVAAKMKLELFGLSEDQIAKFAQQQTNGTFGQLVLTAPIDGIITEQNIVRGRLVDSADTLYSIADLSRVWVWCDVYERDLAALYEKMDGDESVTADIRVSAFPREVFKGIVDMVGSKVDRETRTIKVRIVAQNPKTRLKPGMFADVRIRLSHGRSVIRIPEAAVLSDSGEKFVFEHLKDDLWIRRDITAGETNNGLVHVLKGLEPGVTIATKGAFMFKSEVLKEKMGAGCAH